MGTRACLSVVHGGKFRVAQYCHPDGDPISLGNEIAAWLMQPGKVELLFSKIDAVKSYTKAEMNRLKAVTVTKDTHPQLFSDAKTAVLDYIIQTPAPRLFVDVAFVASGWECEWAYVIDLDKRVLEIYEGLNQERLAPTERFAFLQKRKPKDDFYPARLVRSVVFAALGTESMEGL